MTNHCKGCGEVSDTVYCAECAKDKRCPHNNPIIDCDECYVDADIAFDTNRERGKL